jgi:hypothetical protein
VARIRTIKPQFFRHRRLYLAEAESGLPLRVAFAGLWTCADREGRFKWEPEELKLDCLPYDELEFSRVLDALAERGFIFQYVLDDKEYGVIPGFKEHQVINIREATSQLPEPPPELHVSAHARTCKGVHEPRGVNIPETLRTTVIARDKKCLRCSMTDDLTVDHIFPQSIGGTHAIANLRTLCRPCNSRRPVAGQALIDDLALDGLTLADMPRMCMHVHTQGEGKGKEGNKEGKGKDSRAASPPNEDFETLRKVYPRRKGNYAWKAAERKFNSLVKTGVDPKVIIEAAKRLAVTLRAKIGTEFIPMPASWLNSEDFLESAVTAFEASAEPIRLNWDEALSQFKRTGHWSRSAPANDISLAPPELLTKHGLMPDGRKLQEIA